MCESLTESLYVMGVCVCGGGRGSQYFRTQEKITETKLFPAVAYLERGSVGLQQQLH